MFSSQRFPSVDLLILLKLFTFVSKVSPKDSVFDCEGEAPLSQSWLSGCSLSCRPATDWIVLFFLSEDCFMDKTQYAAGFTEILKLKVGAVPKSEAHESEQEVVKKLSVLCWQRCLCTF